MDGFIVESLTGMVKKVHCDKCGEWKEYRPASALDLLASFRGPITRRNTVLPEQGELF